MPKALTIVKKTAKYVGLLLLALLLVVFAAIPLARWESPDDLLAVDNTQALAVDNVQLVTMTDAAVLADRQLLIRDGRIEAIRIAGAEVGADYQRIDGRGAYVMPGLFDMHTHIMDRKYLAFDIETAKEIPRTEPRLRRDQRAQYGRLPDAFALETGAGKR